MQIRVQETNLLNRQNRLPQIDSTVIKKIINLTNKPIENGTMLMEFEAIFSGRLHISSDLTKKKTSTAEVL